MLGEGLVVFFFLGGFGLFVRIESCVCFWVYVGFFVKMWREVDCDLRGKLRFGEIVVLFCVW